MDVFPLGQCFSELAPLISITVCSLLCKQLSCILVFIHSPKLFTIFNKDLFNIIRHSYSCRSAYNPWMFFVLWSSSEIVRLLAALDVGKSYRCFLHPSFKPGHFWNLCFYVCIIYDVGEGQWKSWLGLEKIQIVSFSQKSFLLDSIMLECNWTFLLINPSCGVEFQTKWGFSSFVWRQSALNIVLSCGSHFLSLPDAMFSFRSEDVLRCGLNQLCAMLSWTVSKRQSPYKCLQSFWWYDILMLHLILWTWKIETLF